jgi:large subunit ribosomal protein L1
LRYFDENGTPAINPKTKYTIGSAVQMILAMQERAPMKFDPTLEVIMKMNLDIRYPDQQIRTTVSLPHGTGKKAKVAVFCGLDEEDEVSQLGAHKWGQQLVKEIEAEKLDFDVLICKPQMMPTLAKLGRILGPKRKMPSPKSGTVVTDYAKAIQEFSMGVIEVRNNKDMRILVPCGKLSFGKDNLVQNVKSLLKEMAAKRPEGAQLTFWDKVLIGSTGTPSVPIDPKEFPAITLAKKDKK